MDVGFISFEKLPEGPVQGYLPIPRDALFEVLSPSNRWSEIHRKVAEYLLMGVPAVYVVDPETSRVHCYYPDRPEEILTQDHEFGGTGILHELRFPVARLFG